MAEIFFDFVQHGHAIQLPLSTGHEFFLLSDHGRSQAERRRRLLSEPSYDLVLSAPTSATHDTALIIDTTQDVTIIPELFIPDNPQDEASLILRKVWGALKGVTLTSFYHHHGDSKEAEILKQFAQNAWEAIWRKVQEVGKSKKVKRVLVTGHDVFLQSCVHERFGKDSPHLQFLLHRMRSECCGFRITVDVQEDTSYTLSDFDFMPELPE